MSKHHRYLPRCSFILVYTLLSSWVLYISPFYLMFPFPLPRFLHFLLFIPFLISSKIPIGKAKRVWDLCTELSQERDRTRSWWVRWENLGWEMRNGIAWGGQQGKRDWKEENREERKERTGERLRKGTKWRKINWKWIWKHYGRKREKKISVKQETKPEKNIEMMFLWVLYFPWWETWPQTLSKIWGKACWLFSIIFQGERICEA